MPRAVVLSHHDIAHELGHLGPWLDRRGFLVERVYRGEAQSIPDADLLIVMGSPTSVATGCCLAPADDLDRRTLRAPHIEADGALHDPKVPIAPGHERLVDVEQHLRELVQVLVRLVAGEQVDEGKGSLLEHRDKHRAELRD